MSVVDRRELADSSEHSNRTFGKVGSWTPYSFCVQLLVIAAALATVGCGSGYPAASHPPIHLPTDIPEEIQSLAKDLQADDPLTRAHAARELVAVEGNPQAAVDCLLAALADSNAMVRAAAVQSLGATDNVRVVQPLIQILNDVQEDRDVRSRAAESLGQLQASVATPSLINALNDTVWHVRYHAAIALGQLGDEAARTALIEAARYDPDYSVRDAAEAALARLEPFDNQRE